MRCAPSSRAARVARTRWRPARPRWRTVPVDGVILVHDGARPLVSLALVDAVAAATATHGAAIPVMPVADTLKRVEGGRVAATVDRTGLVAAQTPQGVRRDVLAAAYAAFPPDGPETWTDEAALLEACRIPVHAIPGEAANVKVTLPDDLRLVETALVHAGRIAAVPIAPWAARVGIGDDGHSFGPGSPLALGGVAIDGAPRLHGHSDGDVVLHAVCDALLGAAGLGDLGRLFPPGPRRRRASRAPRSWPSASAASGRPACCRSPWTSPSSPPARGWLPGCRRCARSSRACSPYPPTG